LPSFQRRPVASEMPQVVLLLPWLKPLSVHVRSLKGSQDIPHLLRSGIVPGF
jgi:hypothetical protein